MQPYLQYRRIEYIGQVPIAKNRSMVMSHLLYSQ